MSPLFDPIQDETEVIEPMPYGQSQYVEDEEYPHPENDFPELVPEPQEEPSELFDPRTNNVYGIVPEEDIREQQIQRFALSSMTGESMEYTKDMQFAIHGKMLVLPGLKDKYDATQSFVGAKWDEQMIISDGNNLIAKYMATKDERYKQAAYAKFDEAKRVGEGFQTTFFNNKKIQKFVGANIAAMGYMWEGGKSALSTAAKTGAAGAAVGAGASFMFGGIGAIPGAVVGTKAGGFMGFTAYSARQMQAGVFMAMDAHNQKNPETAIPHEIMVAKSEEWGAMQVVSELGGLTAMFKKSFASLGDGILASFTKNATDVGMGVAGEGVTEGIQDIMSQFAIHDAAIAAENAVTGGDRSFDINEAIAVLDWGSVKDATIEGAMGATGMVAGGKAAQAGTKAFSTNSDTDAIRDMEANSQREGEAEIAAEVIAQEQKDKLEADEASEQPLAGVTDADTGQKIDGAQVHPKELKDALEPGDTDSGIANSSIEDSVIIDETDTELDDADTERLIKENEESVTQDEIDFSTTLRSILPEEMATAIESILTARASTFGKSMGQYINERGLSLKKKHRGGRGASASVLLKENAAIITAFKKADVSSIAHELGHVFRQEIIGNDKAILDKFVGIKDGKAWGKVEEEQFARAWEKYLADGKAPSAELQGTFQNFTNWMMNIYKTLKGSAIDVGISPEVEEVFNKMLSVKGGLEQQLNNIQTDGLMLEQRQRAEDIFTETKEDKASRIAREEKKANKDERMANVVNSLTEVELSGLSEKKRLRLQIGAIKKEIRKALSTQDTEGIKHGKALMKIALNRSRKRAKTRQINDAMRMRSVDAAYKATTKPKSRFQRMGPEHVKMMAEFYKAIKDTGSFKKLQKLQVKYVLNPTPELMETDSYGLVVEYIGKNIDRQSPKTKTTSAEFLKDLKGYIQEGRTESPFIKAYIEAKEGAAKGIENVNGEGTTKIDVAARIAPGRTPNEQYKQNRKDMPLNTLEGWRKRISTMTVGRNWMSGWNGLMNLISEYDKDGYLAKTFNFHENRQSQTTDVREAQEGLQRAFRDAYRVKEGMSLDTLVNQHMKEEIDIGIKGRLFSKQQLRQLWLYMEDPTLTKRLTKLGYNKTVRANVRKNMRNADKKFATYIKEQLNSDAEYNRNNEVHVRLYGNNMVRLDNYFPILSESMDSATNEGQEQLSQQLQEQVRQRTAEEASGIKSRTKTDKSKIILTGDMGMFSGYQEEMAHFRHYAEKIRLANMVLKDPHLREAIQLNQGNAVYNDIMKQLTNIAADGKVAKTTYPVVDKFRTNFIVSSIGMSATVMMKQFISMVQYAQDIPLTHFVEGYFDFMMNPIDNFNALKDTDFIQNRAVDRELADFMKSTEYKRFKLHPTAKNFITANVRLGDRAAIIIGGHGYVRSLMKSTTDGGKGMTKQQALDAWSAKSNATQQSSTLEEQSLLQQGGTTARMLTMYSSGPVQAARQILDANRAFARGHISGKQYAKTMFIYQMLVPALYSTAASVIAGDDQEDWLKNMAASTIFGPFGSAYVGGRILINFGKRAMGMDYYGDSGPFSDTLGDMADISRAFIDEGFEGAWDSLSIDDWMQAIESVAILMGYGVPIVRTERALQNLAAGDTFGAITGSKPKD